MVNKYYIGLDAHIGSSYYVIMDKRGRVVKQGEIKTTEAELLKLVRSLKGEKALTFEESTLSQWLYVLLMGEVDKLVVCDAAAITKKPGAKTDRIDATELADLLRVDRLRPVFHAADERMELRTLISGYGDLVQEIVRTKNRYNALFRQSAIRLKDRTSYTSDKWISQLETRTQQFVARPLLEQIAVLNQHHEQYLKRFEQNLRRFKEMRHIASVPGFGVVRTNQVVGIVVSPHRFVNKYHFYSYAMLVKHAKDSGGRSYGSIRAHGREELKSIFKMATDSVLRSENAYRRSYRQMLLAGAKQHAARNWVTRALTATVLAVWKKGEKYNDHLWDREVTPAVAGRNKRV